MAPGGRPGSVWAGTRELCARGRCPEPPDWVLNEDNRPLGGGRQWGEGEHDSGVRDPLRVHVGNPLHPLGTFTKFRLAPEESNMANNVYKAVAQLAADSGLPEDTFNNDFYFRGDNPGQPEATDAQNICTAVIEFYNSIPAGATKSISDYLGPQISTSANACSILVYSTPDPLTGAPWGSPIRMQNFTMGTPDASTPLPAEVCSVLSYHGDLTDVPETAANPTPPPLTIRPAARRRGRLYLGPLNTTAGATQAGTNDLGVTGLFRDTMGDAGLQLGATATTLDLTWCVYSGTSLQTFAVVGGYVDSAFDIQRRRGSAALARDSW